MNYLTYNSVAMQVESFQRFDQRAVYSDDGTDYLYTEFTIVVRSFWHPKGIATFNQATAAESMNALRSSLLTPRKQLVVAAPVSGNTGSVTFLRSPLLRPVPIAGVDSYFCDAKNGPQPLFCNIQQIIGEEAMIVDFGIMTWVNECPGSSGSPISPILSHRWSQAHYIDDKFHTRRVVAGQAVLRTDMIYDITGAVTLRIDDFRTYFFHNVPPNYKRIAVNVEASSDGTSLQYTIEDQEVDAVINPAINELSEVADIDGTYSETVDAAPGVKINDVIEGGLTGSAIGGMIGTAIGGPPGAAAGTTAGAAAGAAGGAIGGCFPSRSYEVNIRVYGTRNSTRAGLVKVALRAALGFRLGTNIGTIPNQVDAATVIRNITENFLVSNSIQVGLVQKWVNLRITYRANGLTSLVHLAINAAQRPGTPANFFFNLTIPFSGIFNGIADLMRFFTGRTDTPNSTVPVSAYSADFPDQLEGVTKSVGIPTDSYGPRGGNIGNGEKASRGTTIAHLVASALKKTGECQKPDAPFPANLAWNSTGNNRNLSRS